MADPLSQSPKERSQSSSSKSSPNMIDASANGLSRVTKYSSAPSPDPADTPTASAPKLSNLENIPNEILSKIFLMSHNLSLLETNHSVKDRLSVDVIFNEFALLAFSRTTSCEDHDYHVLAPDICTFCNPMSGIELVTPAKPGEFRFKRNGAYGDRDFCRPPRGIAPGPLECKIEKGCVISISEKRGLQNKILQSSWFSLRHVHYVENSCTICSIETAEGWNTVQKELGFNPVEEFDFGRQWGIHNHRHHIVHGVPPPRRLLESSTSSDDWSMLKKVLSWSTDTNWLSEGCTKVLMKVAKAGQKTLRKAIELDRIQPIDPVEYATGPLFCTIILLGLNLLTKMVHRAVERKVSRQFMKQLLTAFSFHDVRANGIDEHYKAALREAKKLKIEGSSEHAWIYDVLKSKGHENDEEVARVARENLEDLRRAELLAGTDPVAYMSTKSSSLCSAAIANELRRKEGTPVDKEQWYALIRNYQEVRRMLKSL